MGAFRARGTLARTSPILVGDHIENTGNIDCLRAAAAMVDWPCEFIDGNDIGDALLHGGVPIIAIENAPGAENLFKFRPPEGPFAVVVGNERKGISRELLRIADRVLEIPNHSAQLNCLNVAAAAAVALHRLARPSRQIATRAGRSGGRPSVVFAGVDDAIELGSAVRSAACFGWTEVWIADRHDVWFDVDRVTRSLGRGAARRARNPIRVLPFSTVATFDEVCVIGTRGAPLRSADLARGSQHLIVIGDAGSLDLARLAPRVREVQLEVAPGAHPFRLAASIVLAELSRQAGSLRSR
jgi:hypothetical protein